MTQSQISSLFGSFTWAFNSLEKVLIETDEGNFLWKDPEFGGNNSLRKFTGSYNDFVKEFGPVSPEVSGEIGEIVGRFVFVEE